MYGTSTGNESTFVCPGNGVVDSMEHTRHSVPADLTGVENPAAYRKMQEVYDSISFKCTTSTGESKIFGKRRNIEDNGGSYSIQSCGNEKHYIRHIYLRDIQTLNRVGMLTEDGKLEHNRLQYDCSDECGNIVDYEYGFHGYKVADPFYDRCNATVGRGILMIKIWAGENVNGFQVKYGTVPLEHKC